MAFFGPGGNEEQFYEQGYKSSADMPEYLSGLGLNAYEYQCTRGVKINQKTSEKLGENARKFGVKLSIHAPYYINPATDDEEKRQKGIKYITDTLCAAKHMGAERIVVHSGGCAKMPRSTALQYAKKTLRLALRSAEEIGCADIFICPETMGKINQLGTLDEVLELCSMDERLLPTIDFGHINARGLGCLNTPEDFELIFDKIENKLGLYRLENFHSHYSRIEFTDGGEKKHHTFDDIQYGPEFLPIAEIIAKKKLNPTVICESAGNMAQDSVKLKNMYLSFCV